MPSPGFAELIGLETPTCQPEAARGNLTISEMHLNPNGVVHGGALFSLVDNAMGGAVMQHLEEGQVCATIQITMNFLKPVRDGTVECIATVMNRGKKIVNVRGELYVRDTLVGTADGNFAVMQPAVSTLNQA